MKKIDRRWNIVLVCGGRRYENIEFLFKTLDELDIDCIVHGGAPGADTLAGFWASKNKKPEFIVPAQWKNFGNMAGVRRNLWMITFMPVSLVVAFPGGNGTANMIESAKRAKIKVMKVEEHNETPS